MAFIPRLLTRGYRAVDRFLPFDAQLDPFFARMQEQTAPRVPRFGGADGMVSRAASYEDMSPEGNLMPPEGDAVQVPTDIRAPEPQSAPMALPVRSGPPMAAPGIPALQRAATAPQQRVSPWRVLDGVFGGKTFSESIDTERARPMAQAAMAEEDAMARRVFANDERGYLAWRANRAKAGEALASGLEDYTLAPGGVRGRGDETLQRAPFAPITAAAGTRVIDPTTREVIADVPYKPEVIATSPENNVLTVDPNRAPAAAGGPTSARSPEVGQYILGQLQGIPGLKLGSAAPRSEAEIAALPLSAPDTYHRQGAALDFTAPGQKPEDVIAIVRGKMGPGYDVIFHPENGSFHVEPGPQWQPPSGGGARVVQQGAPKPSGFRPITPAERETWGIPAGIPAKVNIATGEPEVISGAASALPKPPPRPIQSAYRENSVSRLKIDRALAALAARPSAVGIPRIAGEWVNQTIDPGGIDARAAIADIGSLLIHDRSGAAVTAAEAPRLKPFVPLITDSPDAARKKLLRLRQAIDDENAFIEYDYPDIGQPGFGARGEDIAADMGGTSAAPARPRTAPPPRKAAPARAAAAPVRVNSPEEARRLPPGTTFITPDGRIKVR